jgi:2-iminoacetate synthase ThiH
VSLADVLDRAAGGGRITLDEGIRLYREAPLDELGAAAHERRMAMYPGDDVTYVVDTTINYTNVCNVHCTFCAFFRPEKHGEGYTMSHDTVLERVRYAADQGATQIMIQGGVNPELRLEWFERLFRRVAAEFPRVDIHSLSVSEIAGLATIEGLSVREILVRLKAAGLKSLPGAGAEILVERVRKRISARKIVPDGWIGVMREAQRLGMPTTATMMFGSIESDEERIAHLDVIRDAAGRDERLYRVHPVVLRPVQDAAARPRSDRRGVLARAGGLAALPRQRPAPPVVVADPRSQARPARAVLRLRRHGRNDHRRAGRSRRRQHERGDPRAGRADHPRRRLQPVIRDTYWNLRDDLALASA